MNLAIAARNRHSIVKCVANLKEIHLPDETPIRAISGDVLLAKDYQCLTRLNQSMKNPMTAADLISLFAVKRNGAPTLKKLFEEHGETLTADDWINIGNTANVTDAAAKVLREYQPNEPRVSLT